MCEDDLYIITLTLEVRQNDGFYTTLENCAVHETEDKSKSQLLFDRLLAETVASLQEEV